MNHKRQSTKKDDRKGKAAAVALMKTEGMPVSVRFWLERYVEEGDAALDKFDAATDESTMELARLIYDVLQSKYLETGLGARERKFSEEARDFVEEFLYRMAEASDAWAWNIPDIAVAALPILLDCTDGNYDSSPELTLLQAGVERLSTRKELREFLKEGAQRYSVEDEDERNNEAAYKLSRVLADPRTPKGTRDKLIDGLHEFSMSARVDVSHPALARRAFQLMCEAKPKGHARKHQRDRAALLTLLDSISEEKGARDEK